MEILSEKMRELGIVRDHWGFTEENGVWKPMQLFGGEVDDICSTDSKILFQENKIRELIGKWKDLRKLLHLKTEEVQVMDWIKAKNILKEFNEII